MPDQPALPGLPAAAGADDRRAELIAAALADDLSPAEADEFARLRASDPSVDVELAELGGLPGALADLGGWDDARPGDLLVRRVAAIADGAGAGTDADAAAHRAPDTGPGEAPSASPAPPRALHPRRALVTALGAAACLLVGAAVGALVVQPRDAVVQGPPGTLGAVEGIDFAGAPDGVRVDGDLVAHTWGTETLLTVEGLPTGTPFSVVVVDDAGREYESGAFLGSEVEIDCALNAAVSRDHVAAVEIRGADGDVAVAEVPAVGA